MCHDKTVKVASKNCDKLITHTSLVSTSSGLKLSRLQKTVMVVFNPEICGETVTLAGFYKDVKTIKIQQSKRGIHVVA